MLKLLLLFFLQLYCTSAQQSSNCDPKEQTLINIINHQPTLNRAKQVFNCENYSWNAADLSPDVPMGTRLLTFHWVCRDKSDGNKKTFVEAIIRPTDLDRGKKTTDETRKEIKPFAKPCGCDQAGHIVARRLGGANGEFNLFSQNANLNEGIWKKIEGYVYDFVENQDKSAQNPSARIQVWFEYTPNPLSNPRSARPYAFSYAIDFLDNGHLKERRVGFLENEDHSGMELEECLGSATEKLLIVREVNDDDYFSHRSCAPDISPPRWYGLLTSSSSTTISFSRKKL